jgi:putative two-component system response regulator
MAVPDPLASAEVLVVDDDEQVLEALQRILERHGHRCRLAHDSAQARAELTAGAPDLVLTDVTMPGDDGIKLLAWIRQSHPTLPVVMVSGIGELRVAMSALRFGAYGWVTKPFDASQVLIAVANALMRAELEERSRDYERHLEQAVKDRTADLQRTIAKLEISETALRLVTEDTIAALTRAIERRDIETGDHITRVSRYATMLARRSGLSEDRCEMIRGASPMHDVGKIGIPDGILLKPERVSAAEFSVIKQHVDLGYAILSRSPQPLLVLAAEIARTHHERWDGTGYQQGLKGEEIPIEGRITAIADTFDALVSRRVYKDPIPVEEAFTIIAENRGTQFDPELTDIFLACREEAVAILADHPDR